MSNLLTVEMLVAVTEHMSKMLVQHKLMNDEQFVAELISKAFEYLPDHDHLAAQELELVKLKADTEKYEEGFLHLNKLAVKYKDEAIEANALMMYYKANMEDQANHINKLQYAVDEVKKSLGQMTAKYHDTSDLYNKTRALLTAARAEATDFYDRYLESRYALDKAYIALAEKEDRMEEQKKQHGMTVGLLKLAGADMARQRDELRAELAVAADALHDSDETLKRVSELIEHLKQVENDDAPHDGSTPSH